MIAFFVVLNCLIRRGSASSHWYSGVVVHVFSKMVLTFLMCPSAKPFDCGWSAESLIFLYLGL